MRIVLIDDDQDLGKTLQPHIEGLGAEFCQLTDGKSGLEAALDPRCTVAIVDVNLPALGGFEVCRRIREQRPALSIIMLSAQDTEVDKILGLERGADDYVTKPFSLRELLARLAAALRRTEVMAQISASVGASPLLQVGPVTVNLSARQASVGERSLSLTATEFDILAILASRAGTALSRDEIAEQLWQELPAGYDHAVTSHISRLRQKLEKHEGGRGWLETVPGFGYRVIPCKR